MSSLVPISGAAKMLGVSVSRVRQLTDAGVLTSEITPGGHRRYDKTNLLREWTDHKQGATALWSRTYRLYGLDETDVWAECKSELPAEITNQAQQILAYAVSEMVNNAIEHSGGTTVSVSLSQVDDSLRVIIQDDGVGAFARMAEGFGYASPEAAIIDVTKGKRTTFPKRHSGEGIFFTSKAVDVFELSANGFRVLFDNLADDIALGQASGVGTAVVLRIRLSSVRDMAGVFSRFTDGEGRFDRTVPRVELASIEGEFMSRGEARRIADGLEKFDRVVLDFTGVDMIGQGFADELFRVWHTAHPAVILLVNGANPAVNMMINRV